MPMASQELKPQRSRTAGLLIKSNTSLLQNYKKFLNSFFVIRYIPFIPNHKI